MAVLGRALILTGPAATTRTDSVGRHVIITGASSASAGHRPSRGRRTRVTVSALARNGDALDDLVAENCANGGQAYAFTCDVTDSASVEHTVKDILGRFDCRRLHLVNNARADRSADRSSTRPTGSMTTSG